MLKYPKLNEIPTSRDILDKFKGYNHNLRIGDGEFYDMKNLTGDDHPILSPRKKRGIFLTPAQATGICSNAEFCYVDGKDFVIGDTAYDLKLSAVDKTLVSMGANVVVMPDQKYINTIDPADRGNLQLGVIEMPEKTPESDEKPKIGVVFVREQGYPNPSSYAPYLQSGQFIKTIVPYGTPLPEASASADPMIRFETKDNESVATWYYASSLSGGGEYKWIVDPSVSYHVGIYLANGDQGHWESKLREIDNALKTANTNKVQLRGLIPRLDEDTEVTLEQIDDSYVIPIEGVTLEGATNGLVFKITINSGKDPYIGQLLFGRTEGYAQSHIMSSTLSIIAPYNVDSMIPKMDYVTESGNRMWGCRYGTNNNGDFVNEIYASVLGNFKDWNTMDNISTDAWVASVGTSGKFTGAINFGGYPIFFKEDCMHRVYGDYVPYLVQMIPCKGVQDGCHKSLAIVNDVLYYKSRTGICAYDGSLPVEISTNFGDKQYYNAVGGAIGNKYYVSMEDEAGQWSLFVYDTIKRMWHKEDDTEVTQFCNHRGELYFIDRADGFIHTVRGTGVQEANPIKWSAETGILGATTPDNKYVTRLDLRMNVAKGSKLSVHIEYDSMGGWERLMEIEGLSLNTFTIPVIPHRCDHFRLKFEGEGDAKIFSISKTLEDAE